jgi:hypothetical protein
MHYLQALRQRIPSMLNQRLLGELNLSLRAIAKPEYWVRASMRIGDSAHETNI